MFRLFVSAIAWKQYDRLTMRNPTFIILITGVSLSPSAAGNSNGKLVVHSLSCSSVPNVALLAFLLIECLDLECSSSVCSGAKPWRGKVGWVQTLYMSPRRLVGFAQIRWDIFPVGGTPAYRDGIRRHTAEHRYIMIGMKRTTRHWRLTFKLISVYSIRSAAAAPAGVTGQLHYIQGRIIHCASCMEAPAARGGGAINCQFLQRVRIARNAVRCTS